MTGFVDDANNGLHLVSAIVVDTTIEVLTSSLVTETPPAGANIVVVGHQFAADDLDVDASGTLPVLTTSVKDLTELGTIPGEGIWIGGDTALTGFANVDGAGNFVNNGFKRTRAVSANSMGIDKSDFDMTTEVSAGGQTVQIFLARVLRNELGALIKRRTYNLERTLGAPDDALPAEVQSEYLVGAVPNELTLNIGVADKITADLTFVALDSTTIDAPSTIKSDDANATKIPLVEADAFNTSSDFTRIRLAKVEADDEAPTALFAFLTELSLVINNNNTPNKAVSVLGAFEVTTGTFEIGGATTAYFANVEAISSVQNNDDVTIDFLIAKQNAGIWFDVPLLTLGDGRPAVEQDTAITIPLSIEAATAAKIDATLDYTLQFQFFDFLPNIAEV